MNHKKAANPSRKRVRTAHSTERNPDTEERRTEDARATREALLLYVGCVRLVVHINRTQRNLAAADTGSKKIIGTLGNYILGLERDVDLMGFTPRELLGTRNLRELQGLLYPRAGYPEFLKFTQIRAGKPDPITVRYGANATMQRPPAWEEHMVAVIIDEAPRMEATLEWAQRALWPRSRDLVVGEDSRALHLMRRLSIRDSDIKSLGVWDSYKELWAPSLGQAVPPESALSPVTIPVAGAGVTRVSPGCSAGASSASSSIHTPVPGQGQEGGHFPPAKPPVKLSPVQYRERSDIVKNHATRLEQVETTLSQMVLEVIPKLNLLKVQADRLQEQSDRLTATVQGLQTQLKQDHEKQLKLHTDLHVCVKELQTFASKPQRKIRKEVNALMERVSELEDEPEVVPAHVDRAMADAMVPKVEKCLKVERKAYKRALEASKVKSAQEPANQVKKAQGPKGQVTKGPEPQKAPEPQPQGEEAEKFEDYLIRSHREIEDGTIGDVQAPVGSDQWDEDDISEDDAEDEQEPNPPVEDDGEDDHGPAAPGTYSPVADRDPQEGTPQEPEAEGPQGIGAQMTAAISSLNC